MFRICYDYIWNMNMLRICLLIVVSCSFHSFSMDREQTLDSLKTVFHTSHVPHEQASSAKTIVQMYLRNDLDSARVYIEGLKKIHEQTGNRKALIDYKLYLALYNQHLGRVFESINMHISLLDEFREDSLLSYRIFSLNNVGSILSELGHYDLSIIYLDSAENLCFQYEDPDYFLMDVYKLKGLLHKRQEDYDTALKYYEKSLEVAVRRHGVATHISIRNNIAVIYRNQKEYDKALVIYERNVLDAKTANDVRAIILSLINMGYVYEVQEDYSNASLLYEQADSICTDNPLISIDHRYNYTIGLARSYFHLDKYDKSHEFYELSIDLADSINYSDRINKTKVLEDRLLLVQNKAELEKERKEKEVLELKNENRNLVTLIYVLGSLMALFLLIWLLRKQIAIARQKAIESDAAIEEKNKAVRNLEVTKEEKKELEGKLKNKVRELTNLAISIRNKNEILDQLKNEISRTKHEAGNSEKLMEIHKNLIHYTKMDRDKDLLHLYIDDIHVDFREKLLKVSSRLNENEIKLSGLIRLGMTSKDIALLMGINPTSVDTYRYNIRKKIGVPKGDSLAGFLRDL